MSQSIMGAINKANLSRDGILSMAKYNTAVTPVH